jgi:hypothetical protein
MIHPLVEMTYLPIKHAPYHRLGTATLMQFILLLLGCCCCMQCAVIVAPTGGPKDELGPQLLQVSPPNLTRNFRGGTIAFTFDEMLLPGEVNEQVILSPKPTVAPQMRIQGRTLTIDLAKGLADSTTYIITLTPNLVDFHEKNPIAAPIVYALSTGSNIDSGAVSGQIRDAYTQAPVANYLVMLYDMDSVKGQQFRGVQPTYMSQSDAAGRFALSYLPNRPFRILACKDTDRNRQYNLLNEPIAMAAMDTVRPLAAILNAETILKAARNDSDSTAKRIPADSILKDDSVSTQTIPLKLLAFLNDSIPPKLVKTEWLNRRNIVLNFNEAVTQATIEDSVVRLAYQEDFKTLHYHLPALPKTDSIRLRVTQVTDTVGNSIDTTVLIATPAPDKRFRLRWKVMNDPYAIRSKRLAFNSPVSPAALAAHFYLQDTGKKKVPITWSVDGPVATATPAAAIDTSIVYSLVADSLLTSIDSIATDTTLRSSWKIPTDEGYGSLSGRINGRYNQYIIILRNTNEKLVRYAYGTSFSFPYLKPLTYELLVIGDQDQNRRWTPGRLQPRQLSERVYFHPEKIQVRANWEITDYVIDFPDK